MGRIWLGILATAAVLLAADNPWAKVMELKSRAELRIYKKGSAEPIIAVLDEPGEERLLVVVKNRQVAIAREDIDRLDARPVAKTARKTTVEQTAKTTDPDYTPHPNGGPAVPGTSYGSNVSFGGSKPDFETVYRRQVAK
jgi:hypothetical protein